MRLAELAYECVKDSINFASSISFDSFIQGDFDEDRDYETQISGVFSCMNLAFSRLAAGTKIPLKLEECDVSKNGLIEFSKGRVVNCVDTIYGGYVRIPFRTTGDADSIALQGPIPRNRKAWVEYEPRVRHFTMDDIRVERLDEDDEAVFAEQTAEKNVDLLQEYGIDEVMCDYVKEFVKGTLMEYISPDLARWHLNLAEQYMRELRTKTTAYYQPNVRQTQGGWLK